MKRRGFLTGTLCALLAPFAWLKKAEAKGSEQIGVFIVPFTVDIFWGTPGLKGAAQKLLDQTHWLDSNEASIKDWAYCSRDDSMYFLFVYKSSVHSEGPFGIFAIWWRGWHPTVASVPTRGALSIRYIEENVPDLDLKLTPSSGAEHCSHVN